MKTRLLLLRTIGFAASLSLIGVPGMSLHGKDKAPSKAHNKKGTPPTAASLVGDMKASVIFIAKNAKDINPKSKQAVPFWASLKKAAEGVDLMEAGIQNKSPDMLKGLSTVGLGVTELGATWGIIRSAHPKSTVGRGLKSLNAAYEMYMNHFGPSVAAFKKGGGKKGKLTDAELAMIEKSGTQLEALLGNLEKVHAAAKPKSYQSRMSFDIIGLIKQLVGIEGEDRSAYAKYQYQWNRLQNALAAYSNITKAYYPAYYKSSWSLLDPITSSMGSLFGSTAWSYYEGWEYSSVSISNYASYYEETSITESITESEETSYEESIEAYDEESATEEDSEDEEEIEEELDEEEDEDEDSLFEEASDCEDDEDGDGVADEEDQDDDNDGVSDEEDGDDDGDGLEDEEEDEEEEEEEEEMEEEDDDGVAECCEGGCCC